MESAAGGEPRRNAEAKDLMWDHTMEGGVAGANDHIRNNAIVIMS